MPPPVLSPPLLSYSCCHLAKRKEGSPLRCGVGGRLSHASHGQGAAAELGAGGELELAAVVAPLDEEGLARLAQHHVQVVHLLPVHLDVHDLLLAPDHAQLAEAHVERRALEAAVLLLHHHHVDRACRHTNKAKSHTPFTSSSRLASSVSHFFLSFLTLFLLSVL